MKKANILKYMYITPYLDEFNKKKTKNKKNQKKKSWKSKMTEKR